MDPVQLLPLVAIVVLFWLMVIRPAARRQKELVRLQESLQPGQQVMLASGIFGTIRSLTEDRVRVEVAAGVEVEVVRGAVNRVVEPDGADGRPDGHDGPTGSSAGDGAGEQA
jgi:preprotein translocase subunit YajC